MLVKMNTFYALIIVVLLCLLFGCDEPEPVNEEKQTEATQTAIIGYALGVGYSVAETQHDAIVGIFRNDLGYTVYDWKNGDIDKINANLKYASVLIYSAHGNSPTLLDDKFNGIVITPRVLITPEKFNPQKESINYKLVFFNGCITGNDDYGTCSKFANVFTGCCYAGWNHKILPGWTKYAVEFVRHLDGKKTVKQAVDDTNKYLNVEFNAYDTSNLAIYQPSVRLKIYGNVQNIVDMD